MTIPEPLLPCRVEQCMVLSPLPRPPQLQEETGPARTDLEVQKKNLPRPPLPHKKNVPATIGMDGSSETPVMWLPRPFSRPPQLEADLLGLTCYSADRLKLQEDGLPRPYWDQKALLPRPCESRSSIPMEGRLREFANEQMGITQDSFMLGTIQGHLLQFNQKLPLVKPTCKCEVKVPRTQESMIT